MTGLSEGRRLASENKNRRAFDVFLAAAFRWGTHPTFISPKISKIFPKFTRNASGALLHHKEITLGRKHRDRRYFLSIGFRGFQKWVYGAKLGIWGQFGVSVSGCFGRGAFRPLWFCDFPLAKPHWSPSTVTCLVGFWRLDIRSLRFSRRHNRRRPLG